MAIDQTLLAADFDFLLEELGEDFTHIPKATSVESSAIKGVFSELSETDKTLDAGFLAEFDFELTTKESLFTTRPVKGDVIKFEGVRYKVHGVHQVKRDPGIRLTLETVNK